MAFHLNFFNTAITTALLCTCLYASTGAHAQTSTAVINASAATPVITGTTVEKKAFRLAGLKGKVVLVMFWSTDCAVCRDKMPELRENILGWADKPFEMVLVSVDKRMSDVDSYNAILNKSVPLKQRFTQLWAGEPGYKDNLGGSDLQRSQLPVTLLLDKEGKLVERFNGRIPAEVWDKIADLL